MARRLARRALLCALAVTLFVPLSVETAAAAPIIVVANPPGVTPAGVPVDLLLPRLHLKLDQANGIDTTALYGCVPGPPIPPPKGVIFFHTIFKPFNGLHGLDNLFGGGLPDDLVGGDTGGGTEGDGDDDLSDFVAIGLPGMQLPRDELGNYKMMVICAEAPPFAKDTKKVAYSVEPREYSYYVEQNNPTAYWRLGESKGAGQMTDSTSNNWDGDYRNGVALGRDGAPNCSVESRATTGCNDHTTLGPFKDAVNDPDKAGFFHTGGYGYVNGLDAPTGAYTIEMWVNPYDSSDGMLFQHGYGPALSIKDGKFVFRQTDQDLVQSGGTLPEAGEWFHVVGTWNGVDSAKLFVNATEVASSTTANTTPSGRSTLYVGNGDRVAKTFNGTIDEVAYYPSRLPDAEIGLHRTIARYIQPKSAASINPTTWILDVTRPNVRVDLPTEGATFNTGKVPATGDWEVLDGDEDPVAPVCVGTPLVQTAGDHVFSVTCTDKGGNTKTVTRNYTVAEFEDVVVNDDPIGYWRMGDALSSSVMEGKGASPDGIYKNADPDAGPVGISGDSDTTRRFLGKGGYGYVNGISHPTNEYTMQAWVNLANADDAMIMQHGRGGALFVKDNKFVFRQTVTDVTSTVTASSLVAGDTFAHVVGTWDGVYARLYIDDVLQGSPVYAPTPPSGVSTLYVGYGEYAPWIEGDLDEVSYFDKALTTERIHEHYIADPPPGTDIDAPAPGNPVSLDAAPSETGPSALENPPPVDPLPMALPAVKGPKASISQSGKARVSRKRGKLVARLPLRVRCPAGATGGCRVSGNLSGRSGAGIAALIGKSSRRLSAGRSWKVSVTLSKTAARVLRKDGKVKVLALVAVQMPDGQVTSETAKLTLRRPAGK